MRFLQMFLAPLFGFSLLASLAAASWFYEAPQWLSIFLTVLTIVLGLGWWIQNSHKWALVRAQCLTATMCIGSAAFGFGFRFYHDRAKQTGGELTYGISTQMSVFLALTGIALFVLAVVTTNLIRKRDIEEENSRREAERLARLNAGQGAGGGYAPLCAAGGAILGLIGGPVGTAVGSAIGAMIGRYLDTTSNNSPKDSQLSPPQTQSLPPAKRWRSWMFRSRDDDPKS